VTGELIRKLRWRSPVSPLLMEAPRKDMYEFVADIDDYCLDRFDKKARYTIRKSLNNCTFRRPTLEELVEEGLRINLQNLNRHEKQDRKLSNRRRWTERVRSMYHDRSFRILGAFYQGRMAGYLVILGVEGRFHILHAFIDRDDAGRAQPMTGLLFNLINQLVLENGRVKVSYGMHTFAGRSSLNNFKRGMRFTPVPMTRGYVVNPLVLLLLKGTIYFMVKVAHLKSVKHPHLGELVRLYQGHRQLVAVLSAVRQPQSGQPRYEQPRVAQPQPVQVQPAQVQPVQVQPVRIQTLQVKVMQIRGVQNKAMQAQAVQSQAMQVKAVQAQAVASAKSEPTKFQSTTFRYSSM
jgi:hypothetical protein